MPRSQTWTAAFTCAALTCAALATGCGSDTPTQVPNLPGSDDIALVEVVSGLGALTALTAPPNDSRLFVVEQSGRILVIADGTLVATPFLDIRSLTAAQGERGLLGLAFHPSYSTNGRFFVNYTNSVGNTRVVEYRVGSNPNVADPNSAVVLLGVDQPFANHNGGDLAFGPDGMLYVAMGDGGSANDPQGHGQNVRTLLGGLLRLDVTVPGTAAIPDGNPFKGRPQDGREELWAWGLRNPWRISFDQPSGLLYVADVGQAEWEEVNVVSAGQTGVNYGWNIMEGPECLVGASCNRTGLTDPVVSYRHPDGCTVIGGAVYRGELLPSLRGHYFYSDLCARFLRSFRFAGGAVHDETEWDVTAPAQVSSMGRDSKGELYVLTVDGRVLRLEPAPIGG